ncbi:MAG: porin family protein [Cruoricaptor ignavus]|nr:porin family protein [Cruoricaptor ignavus]
MLKLITKTTFAVLLIASHLADAQFSLFRTKDRMDRLEGFDDQKFSWGFFLAANNYDYKLVLDPLYGMSEKTSQNPYQKNLVQSKGTYGFGAGLIGKMRLNDNFDLRLEPGLQFAHRELTFDTQENDRFVEIPAIYPALTLTDADKTRTVKSTYIDVPLLLEFHGNRWYNSRPYAAAGINYLINLQSNQGAADDNSLGIYRSTTHNFGWSVEAGIQFYFSRFKLTPAFRGTFITNNEIVKDNAGTPPYWAAAIATAQSRIFMFVLKFE